MAEEGIPQAVLDRTVNRPLTTGWNYLKPGAGPAGINRPPAPVSPAAPTQSWSDWWKSNNPPYPPHAGMEVAPSAELPKALPGDHFYGKKLVWTERGWQPEEGNPDPQQGQYAGQPQASVGGGSASASAPSASIPPAAQHFIRAAIQAKLTGAPSFEYQGKIYQSPPMDRRPESETAPAALPKPASQSYSAGPDFNVRGGGNA